WYQRMTKFTPPFTGPTPTPTVPPIPTPTPTKGEVSNVPIFDRLYLGGSNNLRGFAFRDIGPRDNQGEPLGGLSMARSTVELTFPIVPKARGALFYDTGFVNADPYDFSTDHIASDFGLGIRLDLPIGPL